MTDNAQVLQNYFPNLSEEQLALFVKHEELFKSWNEKVNLVSRKDIENLTVKHILHSLSLVKYIRFDEGARVLDIGTGGGFPGIPLAIYYPNVKFTLVDSIEKKIKVVEDIVRELDLKNVIVKRARAEELKEDFDYVVSRAVAPMPELVGWSFKNCKMGQVGSLPNGWVVLKGGDLKEELSPYKKVVEVQPIHEYFPMEFFETKAIVYIPRQSL
ncbi:MAG: rRNA ((527)-N(7))-methyltransferase RsmG [Bacteroidota bacterium]|jgi:16S rRNA (guanine527-N7)-methyltransferase